MLPGDYLVTVRIGDKTANDRAAGGARRHESAATADRKAGTILIQRVAVARVKRYDRAYFDRWYRDRRIGSAADLARTVAFAVAVTEQVVGRPLRSVLDVGAGEGRWQPMLHRLRPRARYAGVDSSEWAVERWGRRRNLRLGSIDTLDRLGLDGPFDLIVVADVMHYLPDGDSAPRR